MIYREKGAALLMSLIILLVMSLLATSSMQNSIIQERMATSTREGVIALEAAEGALREIEKKLDGLTSLDNFGDPSGTGHSQGWYHVGNGPPVFDEDTWKSATKVLTASTTNGVTPKYFIEYRGQVRLDQKGGDGEDYVRNLNFEGSGDMSGGGGAAGPGDSNIMGHAESMRIVVMATGPSGESRRLIESYYFISSKNIKSKG